MMAVHEMVRRDNVNVRRWPEARSSGSGSGSGTDIPLRAQCATAAVDRMVSDEAKPNWIEQKPAMRGEERLRVRRIFPYDQLE